MNDVRSKFAGQNQMRPMIAFASVILVVGCLYWARALLIPFTLAVLFTFLLSPPMTFLQRRGLPRIPAAVSVVVAAVLFLGGISWLISAQMTSLANQLPRYQENVARRIASIRELSADSVVGQVNRFLTRMNEEVTRSSDVSGEAEPAPISPQPVRIVETDLSWSPFAYFAMLGITIEPLTAAGLVFVFVVFMLIDREDIRNRLFSLIGHGHLTVTTKAIDEATSRISRYLTAQFAINMGYGTVVATGLLCFGVPYAMVWGFFAFCFRYVPLVGPWIAMLFPLTISLLTSEVWLQPTLIISLFVTCELLANLVFDPWLYGKSIGVSQTALMVAIAFWTWLWGAPGLIMAAPLTVCLIVLGKYVPQLKLFDVLLGDEPHLSTDLHFYQRLLAHDQDEAAEIAKAQLKQLTWVQVCDTIYLPTLVNAKRDYAADFLSETDSDFIFQSTLEIFEEIRLSSNPPPTKSADDNESSPLTMHKIAVLACAARDQADEAAIGMFQSLWDSPHFELDVVNTNRMVSEVVSQVEQDAPAIVCIVALPPGGLSHTCLLCKRLRSRFPQLKILVGRWGLLTDIEDNLEQIRAAGGDHFATTMEQTIHQFAQLQSQQLTRRDRIFEPR